MAESKSTYRIPYGLSQSYADMCISLSSKDGTVARVVPLLTIGCYIASILLFLFLMFKTFIGSVGTIIELIIFGILWAVLSVLLFKYDGTRRMNIQRVPSLLKYLPPKSRKVYTRNSRSAIPFWNIVGIKSVADDGLVEYADDTFGYFYRVVGSASILLFDGDRDAILTRVDNFFKKWQVESEVIFLTAKESQKVYRQVYHLQQRYQNLQNDDPDLRDLAEEQFWILRDHIGTEFKSIHQYMIIKSENKEALKVANGILQNEIENSALFVKQCVPLEKDDTCEVLAMVYRKGDS